MLFLPLKSWPQFTNNSRDFLSPFKEAFCKSTKYFRTLSDSAKSRTFYFRLVSWWCFPAPYFISRCTDGKSPLWDAKCKGVRPSASGWFTISFLNSFIFPLNFFIINYQSSFFKKFWAMSKTFRYCLGSILFSLSSSSN